MGDGSDDPVFDRFFLGLRRLWWLLLILGLVGGLTFHQADGAVSYNSSVTINFPGNPTLFELAGLKSSVSASVSNLASFVSSPSFASQLGSQIASGVGVSASVTDKSATPTTLTVVLTGPTRAAVDGATDPVVKAVVQRYVDAATGLVSPMKAAVAASVTRIQQRISQLDEQLAGLDPSGALYQAVRTERIARADDLLVVVNQGEVFQQYLDSIDPMVQRVVVPGSQVVAASSKRLVIGVVLGLFGALAIVAVLSVLDRRMRVRGDVHAGSALPFLGAVQRGFDGLGATLFALSAGERVIRDGGARVAFLCLEESDELARLAESLEQAIAARGGSASATVLGGLSRYPDRLTTGLEPNTFVVPVAVFGRTDRDAFNVLLDGLHHSSTPVGGWVLVSVPARWATRAAS